MGTENKIGNALKMSLLAGAALSGSLLFPSMAGAQAAKDGTKIAVDDIVVTARRTEEKLKDVPVAVTAFSGKALAERRIESQADLQFATPGLTVRETGSSDQLNYAIRGQSVDSFSFASPAVTAYFNEVQTGGSAAASFFDLDSIQVLKGPQGTLFGRNATGGAVLYGAKKPDKKFGGYLKVGYGDFSNQELEGAVNVPVMNGLYVRVSGRAQKRDGLQYNPILNTNPDSIDSQVGRISVLIAPDGSRFENNFMFQAGKFSGLTEQTKAQNINAVGSTYANPLPGPFPNALGAAVLPLDSTFATFYPAGVKVSGPNAAYINSNFNGIADFLAKQAKAGFYNVYTNADDKRSGYQSLITNTTTYKLGDNTTIKNVIGYNRVLSRENTDIGGSPYQNLQVGGGTGINAGYTFGTRQWSEELQISGKIGALKYVAGGFVSSEDTYTRIPLALRADLPPGAANPGVLGPYEFSVTDKSTAVYAQLTYAMTDKLNLSGGLRYTWEDVTIKQSAQSLLSILKDTNQKASKPSWLVGIDYKVTPQLLVYFNHRGSWRTGGFNGTSAASFPNAAAFLSETTYDFELGTKYAGRINGLPAHLNLAVYDQYISNVQRAPYLNQSALGGNVNAAEVKGVEADGGITLVKGFEIGGSVAYTNAKYTDPIGTVPGVGKFFFGPYADTPKWQASAYFRASTNLANDVGELALRGEVYNQSSFYYGNLANSNVPNTSIDGYTLVNARAEWNNMLGSKVNAAAYVNNLLDKNYYTGGFPLGAVEGLNSALVGNPRLWGLELGIKF